MPNKRLAQNALLLQPTRKISDFYGPAKQGWKRATDLRLLKIGIGQPLAGLSLPHHRTCGSAYGGSKDVKPEPCLLRVLADLTHGSSCWAAQC